MTRYLPKTIVFMSSYELSDDYMLRAMKWIGDLLFIFVLNSEIACDLVFLLKTHMFLILDYRYLRASTLLHVSSLIARLIVGGRFR
jgi:hypothetical protein